MCFCVQCKPIRTIKKTFQSLPNTPPKKKTFPTPISILASSVTKLNQQKHNKFAWSFEPTVQRWILIGDSALQMDSGVEIGGPPIPWSESVSGAKILKPFVGAQK